jgi:DNA-binding NtrC family response regulator
LSEQHVHQNRLYGVEAFLGRSAAAQTVREVLARLAVVPVSTLLLTGETGTGKGLAARIVHYGGRRSDGPLVEINCAALPRELLESELFGHEAGAFTGAKGRRRGLLEQADGGTLFLDEIGEMPLDLQAKLLKAIEDQSFRRLGGSDEQRVDVQIIASSNRDLRQSAAQGAFRADLYHRLSVFTLELPALRARKADIDDLVPVFVAEFNAKADKAVRTVPAEVRARLLSHDWPGNVRELRNVVERCVLLSTGEAFPARWLHIDREVQQPDAALAANGHCVTLPLDGSMSLDDMDREIIRAALELTGFNTAAAARALGSTRQTLRYRIQKYGLRADDE